MHTKEGLLRDLQNMGLAPTDAVMVHASMKAVGPVAGGADTVLDAFMEYFREGLYMMPTHTWSSIKKDNPIFDPSIEPACIGLLPNLLRQRPGVLRSLHPTHSIAAWGPGAAEFIAGEENATSPCTPGGCWDRLRKIDDGQIDEWSSNTTARRSPY